MYTKILNAVEPQFLIKQNCIVKHGKASGFMMPFLTQSFVELSFPNVQKNTSSSVPYLPNLQHFKALIFS